MFWCGWNGDDVVVHIPRQRPQRRALDHRFRVGQASIHRSERGAESDVKALATWFVLMAAGGLLSALPDQLERHDGTEGAT
jgi:hypothetical protein